MMYLVAVLAPEPVYSAIWTLKQEIHARTGSRNAIRLPPHVTLLPPWHQAPEQEEALANCLAQGARHIIGFQAEVRDFAWFGNRTLFARVVPQPEWPALALALEQACAAVRPPQKKAAPSFTPHLTLATRDLPPAQVPALQQEFQHRRLYFSFPVQNFTLFRHDGHQWQAIRTFPLGQPE